MDSLVNWLERANVLTTGKRRMISESQSPPAKLMEQLRNELILVKLAKLLNKDISKENINVRPTTAILKERNYKLFLKTCKSEKVPFPKVLKTLQGLEVANFNEVAKLLVDLSKRIHQVDATITPIAKIPKLDELELVKPDDESIYESPYEIQRQTYSDISSSITNYYDEQIGFNQKRTGVEYAIQELFDVESRYLVQLQVLEVLPEYVATEGMKNCLLQVRTWASTLLEFHLELKRRLEEISIVKLGLVFVDMKHGFPSYAPFIYECSLTKELISNGMNSEVIFEEFASAQSKIKAEKLPHCKEMKPDELLTMPVVHVLRYLLILKNIQKEANAQSYPIEKMDEAIGAMQDINNFINQYKGDCERIRSIRLSLHFVDFPDSSDFKMEHFEKKYGRFVVDDKLVIHRDLKGSNPTLKYFMAFDNCILIMDILGFNAPKSKKFRVAVTLPTSKFSFIDDDKVSKIKFASIYPWCGFAILEPNEKKRAGLYAILKNFNRRASQSHRCPGIATATCSLVSSKTPNPNTRNWFTTCTSPDCGRLLAGAITIGVRCNKCENLYHESCFFEGKFISPNPLDALDAENRGATSRDSIIGLNVPMSKKSEVAELMTVNDEIPAGTYLLYFSENKKVFVMVIKRASIGDDGLNEVQKVSILEVPDPEGHKPAKYQLKNAKTIPPFDSMSGLMKFYKHRFHMKENLVDLRHSLAAATESEDSDKEFEPGSFSDDSEGSDSKPIVEEKPHPDVWRYGEETLDFDALVSTDIPKGEEHRILADQKAGEFIITPLEMKHQYKLYIKLVEKVVKLILHVRQGTYFSPQPNPIEFGTFQEFMNYVASDTGQYLRPHKPASIARSQGSVPLAATGATPKTTQRGPRLPMVLPEGLAASKSSQGAVARVWKPRPTSTTETGTQNKTIRYCRPGVANREEAVVNSVSSSSSDCGEDEEDSEPEDDHANDASNLPYFLGILDRDEANAMLSNQRIGTYFLRRNPEGQFRLSVKQEKASKHMVVSSRVGQFYIGDYSSNNSRGVIELYVKRRRIFKYQYRAE